MAAAVSGSFPICLEQQKICEENKMNKTQANLMEKLRRKQRFHHMPWTDVMKSMRTSVDRRIQAESSDRNDVQSCLYTLQRAMKVNSQQSLFERLEVVARHQGLTCLTSNSDQSTITLQADMFHIEIALNKGGSVREVKVAHQGDAKVCHELTDILSRGDFPEFTSHLEGLQSIYQVTGEKKLKSKVFQALQSLEKDLNDLAQFQNSINGVANYIHKSPLGILHQRTAGKPMKLIYFVSPYDLLDKNTLTPHPMTVEAITEHSLGHSVTVCLEPGSSNKLQTMPLMSVAKHLPSFSGLTYANSANLPASFVLVLPQPIPIAMSLLKKIENLTKLDTGKSLGNQPLLSLILDSNSGGKMRKEQQLYVSLPDQHHCYFIDGVPGGLLEEPGVMVSRIPFTHPTHVPKILVYLRQQLLFNSIMASCVRPFAKKDASGCLVFEMTVISLTQVMVIFEHPAHDTMVTADIDISDITSLKCRLLGNDSDHSLCSDECASRILQRCLSLPILLRSLVRKGHEQLERLTAEARALAEEQARQAQEAALWAAAQLRQQQSRLPVSMPSKGRPPPPQPPPLQLTPTYPPTPSPITSIANGMDLLGSPPQNFPGMMVPGIDSQDKQIIAPLANFTDNERGSPMGLQQQQQQSGGLLNESPMLSRLLDDNISVATGAIPAANQPAVQQPQPKAKGSRARKRRLQSDQAVGRSPKHRISESDCSDRYSSIDLELSSSPFESSLGGPGGVTGFHPQMGQTISRPSSHRRMSGVIDLTEENLPESSLKKLVHFSRDAVPQDMKPGMSTKDSQLHALLSEHDMDSSPSSGLESNQVTGSKNEKASTSLEGFLIGSGEVGKASPPDPAASHLRLQTCSSHPSCKHSAALATALGSGQDVRKSEQKASEDTKIHKQLHGPVIHVKDFNHASQRFSTDGIPVSSLAVDSDGKATSKNRMTDKCLWKKDLDINVNASFNGDYGADKSGQLDNSYSLEQTASSHHFTNSIGTNSTVYEKEDLTAPKLKLKLQPFRNLNCKGKSFRSGIVHSATSARSESIISNTFDFCSDEDESGPKPMSFVPTDCLSVHSFSPTRLQISNKGRPSNIMPVAENSFPMKPDKYKRKDRSSENIKRKKDRDDSRKEKRKKKAESDSYFSTRKRRMYRASAIESDQNSGTKLKILVSKEPLVISSSVRESRQMDMTTEKIETYGEKVNSVLRRRETVPTPTVEKLVLQKQNLKSRSENEDSGDIYRLALSSSGKASFKNELGGKEGIIRSSNSFNKVDPKLAKAMIRLTPLNITSSCSSSVCLSAPVKLVSSEQNDKQSNNLWPLATSVLTPKSSFTTTLSASNVDPLPDIKKVSSVVSGESTILSALDSGLLVNEKDSIINSSSGSIADKEKGIHAIGGSMLEKHFSEERAQQRGTDIQSGSFDGELSLSDPYLISSKVALSDPKVKKGPSDSTTGILNEKSGLEKAPCSSDSIRESLQGGTVNMPKICGSLQQSVQMNVSDFFSLNILTPNMSKDSEVSNIDLSAGFQKKLSRKCFLPAMNSMKPEELELFDKNDGNCVGQSSSEHHGLSLSSCTDSVKVDKSVKDRYTVESASNGGGPTQWVTLPGMAKLGPDLPSSVSLDPLSSPSSGLHDSEAKCDVSLSDISHHSDMSSGIGQKSSSRFHSLPTGIHERPSSASPKHLSTLTDILPTANPNQRPASAPTLQFYPEIFTPKQTISLVKEKTSSPVCNHTFNPGEQKYAGLSPSLSQDFCRDVDITESASVSHLDSSSADTFTVSQSHKDTLLGVAAKSQETSSSKPNTPIGLDGSSRSISEFSISDNSQHNVAGIITCVKLLSKPEQDLDSVVTANFAVCSQSGLADAPKTHSSHTSDFDIIATSENHAQHDSVLSLTTTKMSKCSVVCSPLYSDSGTLSPNTGLNKGVKNLCAVEKEGNRMETIVDGTSSLSAAGSPPIYCDGNGCRTETASTNAASPAVMTKTECLPAVSCKISPAEYITESQPDSDSSPQACDTISNNSASEPEVHSLPLSESGRSSYSSLHFISSQTSSAVFPISAAISSEGLQRGPDHIQKNLQTIMKKLTTEISAFSHCALDNAEFPQDKLEVSEKGQIVTEIRTEEQMTVKNEPAKQMAVSSESAQQMTITNELAKQMTVNNESAKQMAVSSESAPQMTITNESADWIIMNESAEQMTVMNESAEQMTVMNESAEQMRARNKLTEQVIVTIELSEQMTLMNKSAEQMTVRHESAEQMTVRNKSAEQMTVTNESAEQINESTEQMTIRNESAEQIAINESAKQMTARNESALQITITNESVKQMTLTNDSAEQMTVLNKSAEQITVLNESAEQMTRMNKSADHTQEVNKSIDQISADQILEINKSTDQKTGIDKSADQIAGRNKSADQIAGINKLADEKAGTNKLADEKAGMNKSADQKTGMNKSADQKTGMNKSADQKAGMNKSADQKVEMNKAAGEKAWMNKSADQKAGMNNLTMWENGINKSSALSSPSGEQKVQHLNVQKLANSMYEASAVSPACRPTVPCTVFSSMSICEEATQNLGGSSIQTSSDLRHWGRKKLGDLALSRPRDITNPEDVSSAYHVSQSDSVRKVLVADTPTCIVPESKWKDLCRDHRGDKGQFESEMLGVTVAEALCVGQIAGCGVVSDGDGTTVRASEVCHSDHHSVSKPYSPLSNASSPDNQTAFDNEKVHASDCNTVSSPPSKIACTVTVPVTTSSPWIKDLSAEEVESVGKGPGLPLRKRGSALNKWGIKSLPQSIPYHKLSAALMYPSSTKASSPCDIDENLRDAALVGFSAS